MAQKKMDSNKKDTYQGWTMNNSNEKLQGSNLQRIIAFFIDQTWISVVTILPILFNFNSSMEDPSSLFKIFPIVMTIAFCLYLLKDSYKGASIGKRIAGLSVKTLDGHEVPKLLNLILRNSLTFIWPIELIAMLASKDGRKLGDRIAKTAVFSTGKKVSLLVKIVLPVCAFILFVGFTFTMTITLLKNDRSYEVSKQFIRENSEVRSQLGEVISFGFLPMGSVSISNGRGEADFTMKVEGAMKSTTVRIHLTKEPSSDWQVRDYKLE